MYYKIRNILLLALLITVAATYFLRNDYRTVVSFDPLLNQEPVQKNIANSAPTTFSKDSYDYEITPVAEYDLYGFVVSSLNYKTWYSMYKYDSTFPKDICVAWGPQVLNGTIKDPAVHFSQDSRYCQATLDQPVALDLDRISNNHLLPKDTRVEKIISRIEKGDQVHIKGKLINVKAIQAGEVKKFDPTQFTMMTSTKRTDRENGACEVIYVEDAEIIAKGNPEMDSIYLISRNMLIAVVIISIIGFFAIPMHTKQLPKKEERVRLYRFH